VGIPLLTKQYGGRYMTVIRKGGVDYRVDELVALLEDKINNNEESEDEMNLYMAYQQLGPLAFGQKPFSHVVYHLMREVDDN
jgi:hypothetical protein